MRLHVVSSHYSWLICSIFWVDQTPHFLLALCLPWRLLELCPSTRTPFHPCACMWMYVLLVQITFQIIVASTFNSCWLLNSNAVGEMSADGEVNADGWWNIQLESWSLKACFSQKEGPPVGFVALEPHPVLDVWSINAIAGIKCNQVITVCGAHVSLYCNSPTISSSNVLSYTLSTLGMILEKH